MIDIQSKNWGIVGAATTGVATAKWLLSRGASVVLVDDAADKLESASRTLSGRISFRPAASVLAADADCWIVSPGVPPRHKLVSTILDRDMAYSDLDLWQNERRALTVAVTGTNGKSTVTKLIGKVFRDLGFQTGEGGNIGTPVVELVQESYERVVLEVSSFQLFYSKLFCPEIAVVTNIAPDHLDWHRDQPEYVVAKEKIAAHMSGEHVLVLPQELKNFAIACKARRTYVGTSPDADVSFKGHIVSSKAKGHEATLDLTRAAEALPYPVNAAFAVAVAGSLHLPFEKVQQSLLGYRPLPYRFATVATIDGVRYVNDSKATNLHATAAAVRNTNGPVRLLAGGKNKNLDWRSILSEIAANVKGVYAYGESNEQIRSAWSDTLPVAMCETMGDAIKAAHAEAVAGETVLLAPGTSSYDQFVDYQDRGRRFDLLVRALSGGRHG